MKKEYGLLMPFVDASDSFTNGFECGQIWEKIKQGGSMLGYLVHLENSAQIQMICDHFECKCDIKVVTEEWGELTTHNSHHAADFLDETDDV